MKTFAAICAHPYGLNPGMLSVDLALTCLLLEVGGDMELTLFDPKQPLRIEGKQCALRYQGLQTPAELERFDCLIYWGDFFHWLRYAHWDWLLHHPQSELGYSAQDLVDQWYRVFLLEHQLDRFQNKIIVFGGTLYGLTAEDFSDDRYRGALTSLYNAAQLVAPRDFVSANFVNQIAPRHGYTLGCDCAFFLDPDAILPMEDASQFVAGKLQEKFIVCSFGRSGEKEHLLRFTHALADRLGIKVVLLDWLGEPEGLDGLAIKLAVLRKAVLVVTDTYHFSISGWREDIPVIGVGHARSRARGTLDDKKKELFFRQILAADYYLYVEDIVAAMSDDADLQEMVSNTLGALENTAALGLIKRNLHAHITAAKKLLIEALSGDTR